MGDEADDFSTVLRRVLKAKDAKEEDVPFVAADWKALFRQIDLWVATDRSKITRNPLASLSRVLIIAFA